MRIATKVSVSPEIVMNLDYPKRDDYMLWVMRDLQTRIGSSLVDVIMRAGGVASVSIGLNEQDDWKTHMRNYTCVADVEPAIRHRAPDIIMPSKIAVPHFEVFPADWYCASCGKLNDGLKCPRTCGEGQWDGCGAPKDLTLELL